MQVLTLPKSMAIIFLGIVHCTIPIYILLQIFSPPIISAGFFLESSFSQ